MTWPSHDVDDGRPQQERPVRLHRRAAGDQILRITDRNNGPSLSETTQDRPFPITVPCATTATTNTGAACSVATTFNAVLPGAVVAGARAVWELGQLAGLRRRPDDVVLTGPNTVFARQGVFVP